VPFGGLVDSLRLPIYGVKSYDYSRPKIGILGREKAFSSQTPKIIETTALIPNKFWRTIKTTKRCEWSEHAHNKSKMADGRHIEKKLINRHISAMV